MLGTSPIFRGDIIAIPGNVACAQVGMLHIGVMVRDLLPDSLESLGGVGNY